MIVTLSGVNRPLTGTQGCMVLRRGQRHLQCGMCWHELAIGLTADSLGCLIPEAEPGHGTVLDSNRLPGEGAP